MPQYGVNQIVTDERLGEVKVLEAFAATENSPEQYLVLTEGGDVLRTTITAPGSSAPVESASEPVAEAPAESQPAAEQPAETPAPEQPQA